MKSRKNITKFPTDFFKKDRPEVAPSNNPDDEIIPIKWSKDILTNKRKAIVRKLV